VINSPWIQARLITPIYPLVAENLHDPNVVKVLRAADGRAITFSRTAIPHVRDVSAEQWHEPTTFWGWWKGWSWRRAASRATLHWRRAPWPPRWRSTQ
jgi:CMP-2-keto-3-deoxyoctulosonic acid synthetase